MARMNLAVKPRKKSGKEIAKKIRRLGSVPAVVYGHGMKPLALEVGVKALTQVLNTKAGENVVINLQVEGVKLNESTCRIKDIQYHPITDEIAHVDFTVISLTEKIEVKVPLVVVHDAEAPGVKEGGVLDVIHHEIEVECLPTEIPEKIEVDVKAMKIGDAISTKELAIPKGVICKLPADEIVVALHPPEKEEAPVEEAAAAEPEVIEKGKKPAAEEEGAVGTAPVAPPKTPAAPKPAAPKKE